MSFSQFGTYNPFSAQSLCLPCQIGFTCDKLATSTPVLCPAGSVCDIPGISSMPPPCPACFFCLVGRGCFRFLFPILITLHQIGTNTRNSINLTLGQVGPFPCPAGAFCLGGVASNQTTAGDYTAPQPCSEGFFCPGGSCDARGSGACPPGNYCPAGRVNRSCLLLPEL